MTTTPTVEEILTKCAAAYANCRTYQDTGESTTVFIRGPRPSERNTQRLFFRTFFQRPDRMFFEYKNMDFGPESGWERSFVVMNEHGVFEWSTLPIAGLEREQPRTLELSLATLTGVSAGTASFAPMLLLPHLKPFPLPCAGNTILVDVEEVDGIRCFRIRGHGQNVQGSDWWIDSDRWRVLRRSYGRTFDESSRRRTLEASRAILATMKPDDPLRAYIERGDTLHEQRWQDFTTESVVTYSPRFDVEIDPSVFEFHPPDESA